MKTRFLISGLALALVVPLSFAQEEPERADVEPRPEGIPSPAAQEEGNEAAAEDNERLLRLHREFDDQTFRTNEEALKEIDFESVDYALLSAAVFHETNRRRIEHELPPLRFREKLREAAKIQARSMAAREMVTHGHPDEGKRAPVDRLDHVGLLGAFSAENVALTFGIRYESERPFMTREEDGTTVFSYEPGGEPIAPHTYVSMASSLLDGWMNSPGHRKNILHPMPDELGTGHEHGKNAVGMDVFYSVQVFFKELDVPDGARVIEVPAGER